MSIDVYTCSSEPKSLTFEFSTNFDEVAEIVKPIIKKIYGKNKIKIKEENYPSNNNYKWHLKTDFSTECELATPVSTIEDLPKIFPLQDWAKIF